ncbi:MAG: hypothetical protein QM667_04775 [Asticcacaulis sp.]
MTYSEDPLHAKGDEVTRSGPEGPGNLPRRRLPWGVVSLLVVIAGFLIAFTAINRDSPTATGPDAAYEANRAEQANQNR